MTTIMIIYNPYKLETKILIDGKEQNLNSRFNFGERRLQEWIDEFPQMLVDEFNSKNFEIVFKGTNVDFEDVVAISEEASKQGINIFVTHKPIKEIEDKEIQIEKIFEEVQNGPFEDLKQKSIIEAFKLAKSKEFKVNVIATMSAGKSTLINSILGQKLMPAKQEACTAIMTEIKDTDSDHFEAKVYDKDDNIIDNIKNLDYSKMEILNSDSEVSKIIAKGDIPFVTVEDNALVLVDTPGPNNSRDPKHREATYRMLSESSKPLVLYIMNATQLAVNDDNELLKNVAEYMKVGGKQSRDRFIFVVNKLDDFKKGEDSIPETLEKVKNYLYDIGIVNPNIYPASALTALNIRTVLENKSLYNEDDVEEAEFKVRKFIRNEEMHFEKYSNLPISIRNKINKELEIAKNNNDTEKQALIHSGVVSIEEGIKLYVKKYSKTSKIKNIVDSFIHHIESKRCFEIIKQQISESEDQRQEIVNKINEIEIKLKNGEDAKNFKEQIKDANYNAENQEMANKLIAKLQEKITKQIGYQKTRLSKSEANYVCEDLTKFSLGLQAEIKVNLENLIKNNLQKTANELLERYKEKLSTLTSEINIGSIKLDPFKLMEGEISVDINSIIASSTKEERVVVSKEWVSGKKWWNPFTWFNSGHYEKTYGTEEYVDGQSLANKFFAPIQENLYENTESALKYAEIQVEKIKKVFLDKFNELDEILNNKLKELKECTINEELMKKNIEDTKEKLLWIENIYNRINEILEI